MNEGQPGSRCCPFKPQQGQQADPGNRHGQPLILQNAGHGLLIVALSKRS